MLLGSPGLESLTTVEIEPEMLRGSRVFLPATRRVFQDPRSHFVIDDAKSFLAQGGPPLDLILSEPSNPWVSGVSSLFSDEFYGRVRERLAPGGVFGQWLHLYEISDHLVLSVLGALHRHFPDYQIYMVHSADMLIVAGGDPELREPDWGVFDFPEVAADLARTHPFHPILLESSRFLNREGLAPLLDSWAHPNSDFFPILDLGAERTRFLQMPASGFMESASGAFDVGDFFLPKVAWKEGPTLTPVPQIAAGRALTLRNRIRVSLGLAEGKGVEEGEDLELRQALFRHQNALALLALQEPPADWGSWLREVLLGAGWGPTTGWRIFDPDLLQEAEASATRLGGPQGVSAALAFLEALEGEELEGLMDSSAILATELTEGRRWLTPALVLDAGTMARIRAGMWAGAGAFFEAVAPLSGRSFLDFRMRLLQAHLDRAGLHR
jgi:hypothetical protein